MTSDPARSPSSIPFALASVLALGLALGLVLASTLGCSAPTAAERPAAAAGNLPEDMPGCRLISRKCSRCHEPERIFAYAPASPRSVQFLVERMRHKGGSSINARDGRAITDCLVVRRFGREGLQTLNNPEGAR